MISKLQLLQWLLVEDHIKANILWLTDTFAYLFLTSWWILQRKYYNSLDRSIAFCRIKRIYNCKFSNNIRYRRYSPTMTNRQCKMSVRHAQVGLYLLYFILFGNFQLWILLILQQAIHLNAIDYNSYFVIFTRTYKKSMQKGL